VRSRHITPWRLDAADFTAGQRFDPDEAESTGRKGVRSYPRLDSPWPQDLMVRVKKPRALG
jgi:hypothetical protein